MDDDFNTALAVAHVFDLVRSVNRVLAEGSKGRREMSAPLATARRAIVGVGEVLGVFTSEPSAYLERIKARKTAELAIAVDEIERLIAERAEARKAKDFRRSDEIRDYLLSRNIMLLDGPQGTSWQVK